MSLFFTCYYLFLLTVGVFPFASGWRDQQNSPMSIERNRLGQNSNITVFSNWHDPSRSRVAANVPSPATRRRKDFEQWTSHPTRTALDHFEASTNVSLLFRNKSSRHPMQTRSQSSTVDLYEGENGEIDSCLRLGFAFGSTGQIIRSKSFDSDTQSRRWRRDQSLSSTTSSSTPIVSLG